MSVDWEFRTKLLLGETNVKFIKNAHVVVIGVGGVGGYCVEALVRSGIGKLTLVDEDVIDITNINRHVLALRSTVGKRKVLVAKERILDINPECIVITFERFFLKTDTIETLGIKDPKSVDFVVDACDTIDTKIRLIEVCQEANIPLITSTGAARRIDPTRMALLPLEKTSVDKLAQIMRQRLREKKNYKALKTMTVFSTEPLCNLSSVHPPSSTTTTSPPTTVSVSAAGSFAGSDSAAVAGSDSGSQTIPSRGPLPSFSTVPAAFGLAIAFHVIKMIIEAQAIQNENKRPSKRIKTDEAEEEKEMLV